VALADSLDVGASVVVRRDDGADFNTKTRSAAWLLPSGVAVVQVERIAGCYLLSRVKEGA
jgi:hypothetical protein